MLKNRVTARGDSLQKVTAHAVTVTARAVTKTKPSPMLSPHISAVQTPKGDRVTARRGTSLNLRKEKKSIYTGIRAREAVTVGEKCPLILDDCQPYCGYHAEDENILCTLLTEVPKGENPRDWYLRLCDELKRDLSEVSPCLN